MDKNNKKISEIAKKGQNQGQKTGTCVVNKKKGKMYTNLNKSVGEIKHKESLLGNNVLNNKSKGPKTGTVSKQKENLKSASNNLGQGNSKKIGKDKTANNSKKTLDKKGDMSNELSKNVSIEYKPLLIDHGSKLDNKGKDSKTEVIKNQEINTNLKKGANKTGENEFSIFAQDNLEQDRKNKIIDKLKKIFDQYEKAQYKDKLLEISGKGNVSIEQLIDCYASDVQGFGDCGPLSILESRSDNKNCRMKDWRFRSFLSNYVDKKLDVSFVWSIDLVLNTAGYKNCETRKKFLDELIFDGNFKMLNEDKTDNFYSNKKVEELRKEILNAIEEISKLYTNVIQQNKEYKNIQDCMSFPSRLELMEILNYFPLNMEGNLNELVDEDTRNYEKQELLKSKININAKILFMALSYIEKKPIFCLMDSEDEKGLFVFDASRISDPKLKHKCIFRLDNNSMDNQIEYPLDLIYDFRKQLDNKDHPVFFFRSKPNHHFQYLDPKDQEKRTAFNNDMNRFFFDKCIERVLKLDSEERKKLQDEFKQKEDLLQKQKAEFQTLQKMAILNSLQVLANACLIAWTSYIAYAFAWSFKSIFQVCQRYVDNFNFAKELNQKISETLKSDVEQSDCFENSINDLMSYIDSTQNIERKLLEKLLPVYVMLAKYYPQHDTENMLQKLQSLKSVQQVGIISNPDFYIKYLQNQTNDKSDKMEPNSQNNIIKDKSNDSVNSTEVTSVSENKTVPIVKPLTNETLDKNKGK